MKKVYLTMILFAALLGSTGTVYGQAAPSTEGNDFWVTFLRAQTDAPKLILTVSALKPCTVTIENPNKNYSVQRVVGANTSTDITISNTYCYSTDATNYQPTYTALHVTSTEDISLFAGNYISKTFDAANILPTAALLDDYVVQTYPPSDHSGTADSRGSHFAIVAVEDGTTTVDLNLTAKTTHAAIGAKTITLQKGQVYYIGTGTGTDGPTADLSGSTVKARGNKKIAVFQGCPHTNVPYMIRDRDHLFSQAMPTAYWGSEFVVTASRQHRRDVVAIMALNDHTEVYINDEDGEPQLIHTIDFSVDTKHYWTFEIGEYTAYCNDSQQKKKLPSPQVADSSCYITTSCAAGVHLFMVSNKYDNVDEAGTNKCDPAMLWISPIEQVIKDINFSTYNEGTETHYMNIVTTTANVPNMLWTHQVNNAPVVTNIASYFDPVFGAENYSFARIQIDPGTHRLQGSMGFLAHVYGYGTNESYAYSCGSSTVQSGTMDIGGAKIGIDSVYRTGHFYVGDTLEMKLNLGTYDYQSIVWDYGDGVSYVPYSGATNNEKRETKHTYEAQGWYDMIVSAVYINRCTGQRFNKDMHCSFYVKQRDTLPDTDFVCAEDLPYYVYQNDRDRTPGRICQKYNACNATQDMILHDTIPSVTGDTIYLLTLKVFASATAQVQKTEKEQYVVHKGYDENGVWHGDTTIYSDGIYIRTFPRANSDCDSTVTYDIKIVTCLAFNSVATYVSRSCDDVSPTIAIPYSKFKGNIDTNHPAELIIGANTISANNTPNDPTGTFEFNAGQIPAGQTMATLRVYDATKAADPTADCATYQDFPVLVAIPFPNTVFAKKFYNVLAVYNKAYNGGYNFVSFQWYKDGMPIEGAETALYHADEPLNGIYSVYLKTDTGVEGMTCPREIRPDGSTDDQPNGRRAPESRKIIQNQQLYIEIDGALYDTMGHRLE